MVRRELSVDERKIYNKNEQLLKMKLESLEGDKKIIDFKLGFELLHTFEKQKIMAKETLKKIINEIELTQQQLNVVDDHMKNGVERKEIKASEREEKVGKLLGVIVHENNDVNELTLTSEIIDKLLKEVN